MAYRHLPELEALGWNVSAEVVDDILEDSDFHDDNSKDSRKFIDYLNAELLDSDLHGIGQKILKDENLLESSEPFILQIDKLRNIAIPKMSEEKGKDGDRFLRLVLSDGNTNVIALEMQTIRGLQCKCPPGTKIKIFPEYIQVERGFWLLTNKNCQILGGNVKEIVAKWKAEQDASKRRLAPGTASGPPPWVPFGVKVDTRQMTKDFMAMMSVGQNDSSSAPPVSQEFEESRKNVIAQVQQTAPQKVFASAPISVNPANGVQNSVNNIGRGGQESRGGGRGRVFRGRGRGRGRAHH